MPWYIYDNGFWAGEVKTPPGVEHTCTGKNNETFRLSTHSGGTMGLSQNIGSTAFYLADFFFKDMESSPL